ncbi:lambda family phage tail tape measure protein [Palleronia aestuarii]|uniref:Lambda family phage tail tape measure protein n=1 Tax=Palleronia aestuarii TaxID=568105 RepID=A0A2W7NC22_9RHOB|nr:phage tail tape measure protein [Palleronia aestuarii]PZX17708.1 lambda family phage tail tape measure protein [Palleronia aestuarii]
MSDDPGFEGLDDDLESFGRTAGGTRVVIGALEAEMRAMQQSAKETNRQVGALSKGLSGSLKKSFEGLIFDGMKASDALKGVARSIVGSTYDAAMKPLSKDVSGLFAGGVGNLMKGLLPFENGAPFSQGRVLPFAQGGIVSGPTAFPMRGATGLMGEAGPEAIMPLARGADGQLGVRSGGGARAVNVTMNIQTPDVSGFQRSQSQIAAQMSRALSRGQRNR